MTQKCRIKEDIAIGLIDSMIISCRFLAPMLSELSKDELSQPIVEALKDLTSNEDVLSVLRAWHSRYIISEEKAVAFDGIIREIKKSKRKIII